MSIVARTKTSVRFQHMINGRRYSKTIKTYGLTKAEIIKKHSDWIVDLDFGRIAKKPYTVKEYAAKWLEMYAEPNCRPRVVKNYRNQLKNHIIPKFGNKKLESITPLMINDYILELKSTKSKQNPSRNISINTIKKIYAVFKNFMHTAYINNLIATDPFSKVKLNFSDMEKEQKIHVWGQDDFKKAIELLHQEESDNRYLVEFALKTGLRLSEIFGLDWKDIDFENNTIDVTKSRQKVDSIIQVLPCKTGSSKRKITIPQSLVDLILEYREKHPNNKYLFSNLDPDSSTAWYRKWLRGTDLPYIRFHDLRHTHASLLLCKSVDIKTISQRLGHSNIGITMNVYTHVMEELDRKASLAIDAI